MSLFKARDFWSFKLNDLPKIPDQFAANGGDQNEEQEEEDVEEEEASFVADLGRFQAINEGQHDVLVCSSLLGLVFIIQVPESEQQKRFGGSQDNGQQDRGLRGGDTSEAQRQLLLVKKLDGQPIVVDIKCGYFSSTTKQSVALLTSNKLIVFQVKQQQQQQHQQNQALDLVSGDTGGAQLFSHFLEEQYRVDLVAGEFAQSMVVLSRRHDCDNERPTLAAADKLSLPQRDSILVQYTNQLIISLLDHKKVIGHYKLKLDNASANKLDQSMWKLAQSTGYMPAAYLNETQSLVISLSDRRLCCLALAKLSSQAKENVVRRVAKNLLVSSLSYNQNKQNNNTGNNSTSEPLIELELDKSSEWQRETISAPLQLIGVSRETKSQLLLMSRYNLDLYSSSGQHLWSQRFETSLICTQIYTSTQEKSSSQLFVLVCSDCLSNDKCNLSIMLEDQIVWSALLNSKPIQLWRAHLQRMSGLLVSLDGSCGQLKVSYLGTNKDQLDDDDGVAEDSNSNDMAGTSSLSQLETLNDCFVAANGSNRKQHDPSRVDSPLLTVRVHLEASDQWPNVSVGCKLSIQAPAGGVGLIQNIILLMDFDETLQFDLKETSAVALHATKLADSAVQLQLGNCWPDRREPLVVEGTFRLRSSSHNNHMDHDQQASALRHSGTQTRSLNVNLVLKYNEIRSSVVIQEESFLLPLSLISQLTMIDYSSENSLEEDNHANLDDVLANLGPQYEPASLKCCDIFLQSGSDLLELVDQLIEEDLVCRGLDRQTDNNYANSAEQLQQRRLSTLENMNLLAQSLDCRLRFKSLDRPPSSTGRSMLLQHQLQGSEEVAVASGQLELLMVSVGLRWPADKDLSLEGSQVWLHLLDLRSLSDRPGQLVEQFVRRHFAGWKWQKLATTDNSLRGDNTGHPILLSIESEQGQAIMMMQLHLVRRLAWTSKRLDYLHEQQHDSLEINLSNLTKVKNSFFAVNGAMYEYLRKLIECHDVRARKESTREELTKEFRKFQFTASASLSLAKKLSDLPQEKLDQFTTLNKVISHIQLNLTKLLSELDKLERMEETDSRASIDPSIRAAIANICSSIE